MAFVEPDLDPTETLFGKLQRGQGRGHLDALDTPAEALAALDRFLLTDCVRCCDPQLDERDRYIAEVATDVGWSPSALIDRVASALQADPDADGFEYTVLMRMARREHELARRFVIDSLTTIEDWGFRLGEMLDWEMDLDGAANALLARGDSDDEIREALSHSYGFKIAGHADRAFIESIPRFAPLLPDPVPPRKPIDKPGRQRSKRMDKLIAMSTAELLDRVEPNLDGIVTLRNALASPNHDLNVDLALNAARNGSPRLRAAGMVALGAHQIDELLDIAPELVTVGRAAFESATPDHEVQFAAYFALQRLRTDRALECANLWLDSSTALAQAALPIIAARMSAMELVTAYERHDFNDVYLACDIVDQLNERGESGAEDMVRGIYESAAYDMLRERCVRYLLEHDKRFLQVDGLDALWDASDLYVRPAAIETLPLSVSEARLRELSSDLASDVSSAAAERLQQEENRA